ncbi:MAG: glycosyltransferase family 4 protein [Merismopedia sp. SIO2A8]|nr:glycosyltransferase family 4 protein [Symploca sp. SIO2B6]NET52119.1 glycosyltransferase family 4 protein [Merismopedia sp. SIO2A8]
MSTTKMLVKHSRRLKLLIITQFYPPDYAATGQLIAELAIQLGRLGLPIQVFTGQPSYAFQTKSAPKIEHLGQVVIRRCTLLRTAWLPPVVRTWFEKILGKAVNGLLFFLRSALHLLDASSRGEVLLLTTAPPFLPILGYFANLILGLPYVCLLYDLYPDIAVELGLISADHWSVRLWDAINRRIWKRAQQIIVLSATMKHRVAAKCPEVIDKIGVIHSWADPAWILPIAKEDNWFAKQFNLVDTFTVLYSGNMGRCHDMDTIFEVVKLLQQKPIQFVFIGSGAKRQVFQSKAKKLGLRNCQFLPYQDKKNLPYSLTACDLSLVSVSEGMEGLVAPSKLYGALAAGRPVAIICESHSYLQGILNEAACGKAFSNGDAAGLAAFILHLAANPDLVKLMGKAGRDYMQCHFTPELIAQQYSQLLFKKTNTISVGGVTHKEVSV